MRALDFGKQPNLYFCVSDLKHGHYDTSFDFRSEEPNLPFSLSLLRDRQILSILLHIDRLYLLQIAAKLHLPLSLFIKAFLGIRMRRRLLCREHWRFVKVQVHVISRHFQVANRGKSFVIIILQIVVPAKSTLFSPCRLYSDRMKTNCSDASMLLRTS